jgi:hydrogenase maturation protease
MGASESEPRDAGQASSILLVGFGNLSRRDDGVAFHIIRRLRERLGLPAAADDPLEDAYDDMGPGLVAMCLHQLAPELAETLAQHDVVVFIDAHVAHQDWEALEWREVAPHYRANMVSHHLTPDAVLALSQSLFGSCPRGYILSVLGTDFDFGTELSPTTAALVDDAVEVLLDLMREEGISRF